MANLRDVITRTDYITFVFQTGLCKRISLHTHQLPLAATYEATHHNALHNVRLQFHYESEKKIVVVWARTEAQLERHEYLIKRALLDLKERYRWEVETCY